jgi:hypothetical protein
MRKFTSIICICLVLSLFTSIISTADSNGLIQNKGKTLFPLGFYELPKDDADLKRMAESGVNLIRCGSKNDLDRIHAVGIKGVISLPFQNGATDKLKQTILELKDHPALAVWEGPDEIAWNFTAASMLFRTQKNHKVSGAWWKQTPTAVEYARQKAEIIIPNMRDAVDLIRKLDKKNHPVWINEALESDLQYVRQYLKFVDITGCDTYPVNTDRRRVYRMGQAVDRWQVVGKGKPVWMVLQAFSWHELGDYYGAKEIVYPTFDESRFMAYNVITHGAKGILYWGSAYLKNDQFRQSVYALTSELAVIQPFLTAPEQENLNINLAEMVDEEKYTRGVSHSVRRIDDDWLIILVNEDDVWHMGVELTGLEQLEGKQLFELYSSQKNEILDGALATRLAPYGVKVFATSNKWETQKKAGRDFVE